LACAGGPKRLSKFQGSWTGTSGRAATGILDNLAFVPRNGRLGEASLPAAALLDRFRFFVGQRTGAFPAFWITPARWRSILTALKAVEARAEAVRYFCVREPKRQDTLCVIKGGLKARPT
jgi:hypothetical protein